jgi:hypothetical protein
MKDIKNQQPLSYMITKFNNEDVIIIIDDKNCIHYVEVDSLKLFFGDFEFVDFSFEFEGLFTYIPKEQIKNFSDYYYCPRTLITCIDVKELAAIISRTKNKNLKQFMLTYVEAFR